MVVKHDSNAQVLNIGLCVHTNEKVVSTYRKPVMSPTFTADSC